MKKAILDLAKADAENSKAMNKLYGTGHPPQGSKEWWDDMHERNKALREMAKISKEISDIQKEMEENGCP